MFKLLLAWQSAGELCGAPKKHAHTHTDTPVWHYFPFCGMAPTRRVALPPSGEVNRSVANSSHALAPRLLGVGRGFICDLQAHLRRAGKQRKSSLDCLSKYPLRIMWGFL